MDYKEKYEQALERMKSWTRGEHPECFSDAQKAAEFIFPELAESEDERIRKELITFIKKRDRSGCDYDYDKWIAWLEKQGKTNSFDTPKTPIEDTEEVTSRMQYISDDMKPIADFMVGYAHWNLHKDEWNQPTLTVPLFRALDALIQRGKPYGESVQNIEGGGEKLDLEPEEEVEKQGEQKPADRTEPKFHEGEWIVFNGLTLYVKEVVNGYYRTIDQDDIPCSYDWDIDNVARLWTIQDAKDGDVLTNGSNIFIFHFLFLNNTRLQGYCHVNIDNELFYDDIGSNECFCLIDAMIYPATKEQRDFLFLKMKEAGYEWDAEEKWLNEQPLKTLPKFCIGQLIRDDNGKCYEITNIKHLGDWYYEVYDVIEDDTHHELCSYIDKRFRENLFVDEIKKMMGD